MTNGASKLAAFVTTLVIGAVVCVYGAALFRARELVYPTPDRKSAFLDNFKLEPVLKPYVSPRWVTSLGESDGSEAGYGATHFDKSFEVRFAMNSADRPALMASLADDIVASLSNSRMQVFESEGNDTEGFHFRYGDGRSSGIVTVSAVRQLDEDHLGGAHGSGPEKKSLQFLQPGEIPVEFAVAAQETWTK